MKAPTQDTASDEVELQIKQAKHVIKFTSLFLRHEFYSRLEKSSSDGYCCMEHALGVECQHKHCFHKDKKLSLVLTAHVVVGKAVEMVSKKVLASKKILDFSNHGTQK